jgi:hypothetical protein
MDEKQRRAGAFIKRLLQVIVFTLPDYLSWF